MFRKPIHNAGGFTLIELLIVVAIIAILAAIAVPNFLEAQVRAKISRAKSDMRTIGVGLESYFVDLNVYPVGISHGQQIGWWTRDNVTNDMAPVYKQLTTPVAYLTSIPEDCFMEFGNFNGNRESNAYWYDDTACNYFDPARKNGFMWCLRSWGPSRDGYNPWPAQILGGMLIDNVYDATNGTKSVGYMIRTNKGEYPG